MKKTKESTQEQKTEAYARGAAEQGFILRGIYGFGCGTEKKDLGHYRKILSWEEKVARFQKTNGD